ncbi:MAG TPA: LPXTG cell wall anchor domain-containing protein [Brevundimonas sp.]|jgi:LPXTG-motif cell wall-anchored protein|uniref:LPXTG cell wall anchor domain-containing protein n=1 Tax=Brevundimonas sp. TaxID=1871086 RepID=UPI002DE51A16|nr:LPXTG cell wall anchor domain-containing protein [Brevundimonas sp.]
MKLLRVVLLLAVLAYAGWLAWPVISPLIEGADPGAAITRVGAEMGAGGTLTAVLWIGAILLYLIAAGMLGSGNPRAAAAYFLGFLADAALRLAIDRGRGGAGEMTTRSAEASIAEGGPAAAPGDLGASLGVDPMWLVLGGLVLLGLLIVVATRRRRRARTPGQLAI